MTHDYRWLRCDLLIMPASPALTLQALACKPATDYAPTANNKKNSVKEPMPWACPV
jgi:hypothetical protein